VIEGSLLDEPLHHTINVLLTEHEMVVTSNRTCVLFADEVMITQRINTHLVGTQRAALSVSKHLGNRHPEAPAEKSLPNVRQKASQNPLC